MHKLVKISLYTSILTLVDKIVALKFVTAIIDRGVVIVIVIVVTVYKILTTIFQTYLHSIRRGPKLGRLLHASSTNTIHRSQIQLNRHFRKDNVNKILAGNIGLLVREELKVCCFVTVIFKFYPMIRNPPPWIATMAWFRQTPYFGIPNDTRF